MNETYLAWIVIGFFAVAVLPFYDAAIIRYQPTKERGFERLVQVWFVGLGVALALSAITAAVFSLVWALSVVMK